ncbi:MAG: prolyl oligopeptidase family serine peptidase [Roseivirga sp.]|nr:prolyl oligopeptidase family serine peptidase [Roseivirga sp.]
MLRQSLITILCLVLSQTVCGQTGGFIQLRGLVLEEKTNELVPFATVRIKGASVGTITDLKGSFSFWVSERYKAASIIFSSVGYLSREMQVAQLNHGQLNRIILKPDTLDLGRVTVVRDKQLKPLEVLKRAIARIPDNYQDQTILYDAYYRERILENGAVIKYADAAVTFQQSPYDGKRYNQKLGWGPEWKSSERYGTWLASYRGLGRAKDRLHDHFGHKTSKKDLVSIHQARISQNNTKERLQANIEAGPLGTLSKDLVKYLAHFMDHKNFKDYVFELLEIPDKTGGWDYMLKFEPKKAPRPLEEILASTGRTSRMYILSGEIYIDKTSFVIKKMNYRVGQKHRRHICNLQRMSIKHYGYQVDVDYMQHQGRWQMKQIKRVDEFIFKDTISQKNTPYSAISEIFVTQPRSEILPIPESDNYRNLNHNSLQSYEAAYNAGFWKDYENKVPQAKLSSILEVDEYQRSNLERQFARMKIRNPNVVAPVAKGNPDGPDIREFLETEGNFAEDYFGPLEKIQFDLLIEFDTTQRYPPERDSVEQQSYDRWSDFKKSRRGHLYQIWEQKATVVEGAKVDVSLIFMGKDKDRWLKERPALVSLSSEKPGIQMKYDPALMPLLNRGMILVYVHLKGLRGSGKKVQWKNRLKSVDELIGALTHLKDNALAHPEKIFVQGTGVAGGIVASAINKEPELLAGAFLSSAELDPMANTDKVPGGKALETLKAFSPHGHIKVQAYPNIAFFTTQDDPVFWQSVRMMARLRAHNKGSSTLLLKVLTGSQIGNPAYLTQALEFETYKYALLFQWIDDVSLLNKRRYAK